MPLKAHYILDFSVLGIVYILMYFFREKERDKWHKLIFSLTFLYLSLVLFVTLMPFQIINLQGNELYMQKINLRPFNDILEQHLGAKRETYLNIIMFLPLGFFLPQLKKRGFFKTLFIAFCGSLFIELMQLLYLLSGTIYLRAFDVTDLINNTLGGALGYLIYIIFKPLIKKLEKTYTGSK